MSSTASPPPASSVNSRPRRTVGAGAVPRRSPLRLLPFSVRRNRRPERVVPNIWNNQKVFTVFQGDPVSRSTFFLASGVLPAVEMGWPT